MELDLAALRAFVAVVDEGQFGHAAAVLGISQQAVSKRIAKLEAQLEVVLLDRGASATTPTGAGMRLLPHARTALTAVDEAQRAVRDTPRPLRVAILGDALAPGALMRFYLRSNPESEAEIVFSNPINTARDALLSGRVDATFARAHGGPAPLPPEIRATPAYLEPLYLLVHKDHPLGGRSSVRLAEITPHPVWVPGAAIPSEWADFYRRLAEFSGITIDTSGPLVGLPKIADRIAASPALATFDGESSHIPWNPNLRRVNIIDPTPAYPHALLWAAGNPHPELPHLIDHIKSNYTPTPTWAPQPDHRLFAP
ncbi:LysR family transcriptional regulator [Nocardia sp. NPDC059180]|uniref:LysR family transcriptional regulator n=1 Tax=Nocardia sp. NPDC059180 TaxID=3346761 RepID=UPI00368D9CD2